MAKHNFVSRGGVLVCAGNIAFKVQVTAEVGHQIEQRAWMPEWAYPLSASDYIDLKRLANYLTKNHKYFSGIELSWVAKGREYERLQTSCANAKQHLLSQLWSGGVTPIGISPVQLQDFDGHDENVNWRKASDGPHTQISLGMHVYGAT
ncbi:unnamed protein product [Symbiodinium sp. KB8]|nr:unnamed protein product [Symbiodinium sp. KB8]